MKIVLMAVNAKYIHSNPAVYSLAGYARKQGYASEIKEYTINMQPDEILRDLYKSKPEVLGVSVYIWNRTFVRDLLEDVSKILPETEIWLGGPEVTYAASEVLQQMSYVKGVMRGEGEVTFAELCACWEGSRALETVQGITWRADDGQILTNPMRELISMDEIPFLYDRLEEFQNRIIYYESSRGCPFSCCYCLSSVEKKLRFRSLALVLPELQFFLDHQVKQVKFVDRTFNCSREHTKAVWSYLKEHDNGVTNFHFEVSADLLDQEEMELLASMRPGLVQLEIGVQSVNPETLQAIHRTANFKKIADHVLQVQAGHNVHQHLDLIAGLPYEDFASFGRSFDQVYALAPDQLQLGFLKVLRGAEMYEKAQEYGCVYKNKEPYEVLSTKWLSYEDVLQLKLVEEMTEVYYNSRQFESTLEYAVKEFDSAFAFYLELGEYYETQDLLKGAHSRQSRYDILKAFLVQKGFAEKQVENHMLLDLYARENLKTRPSWAPDLKEYKDVIREFYQNEAETPKYLTGYVGYDWKQLRSMTHIEILENHNSEVGQIDRDVVLFDYRVKDPLDGSAARHDLTGQGPFSEL